MDLNNIEAVATSSSSNVMHNLINVIKHFMEALDLKQYSDIKIKNNRQLDLVFAKFSETLYLWSKKIVTILL